jgi:hypothetical protein
MLRLACMRVRDGRGAGRDTETGLGYRTSRQTWCVGPRVTAAVHWLVRREIVEH